MIAGDLNATSIKEAIAKASSTGSLSNHTSSVESLSNITGDKWVSILRLGMEAACYDANKQNSFEQQCKTWRNMDLSQLSTYIQIMACELFNFDACVGIFGGQFCTDYERFKVLKGALEQHHLAVSDELEDIIVESIDTDTLSMEWEDISELIRKAFTRATRRKPIRPEKDDEPLQTHHSRMKPCPSIPTPDAPFRAAAAAKVATAFGLANVAMIARTKFQSSAPSSPANASIGGSDSSSSGRAEPSFNIVGRSNDNILLSAIQSQFDQPLRAYVVARDVTNQQQLDGVISTAAST